MNYKVRVATSDDASAVQAIYAPMVLDTVISFELIPPTVDEMAARIAATVPIYPFLVAEVEGKVVGYAYAGQHRAREAYRWSVDVTVYIDPAVHRKDLVVRFISDFYRSSKNRGFMQPMPALPYLTQEA